MNVVESFPECDRIFEKMQKKMKKIVVLDR